MNIEILINLRDYPTDLGESGGFINEGIPLSEIEQLEQNWNNGNSFPVALRELLFLGGKYCYLLDYTIYDSQQEMQEGLRDEMQEDGNVLTRPFYIIDNYGGAQFLFIYLDENQVDPNVYEYVPSAESRDLPLDRFLGYTLSHLINSGIEAVKEGRNPF